MKISFSEMAWAEYVSWQSEDKKTLKRINQLLQDIMYPYLAHYKAHKPFVQN